MNQTLHHNDVSLKLHLADEVATHAFAAKLAAVLQPGLKIYLSGELGSGKTSLVRGVLRALGFSDKVKSPTFTLAEVYDISDLTLYHFDFYRLENAEEWLDAGFDEYFDSDVICFVEWPERAAKLPPADLWLKLDVLSTGRNLSVKAQTATGETCLTTLQKSLRKN